MNTKLKVTLIYLIEHWKIPTSFLQNGSEITDFDEIGDSAYN
jgi:hypothetical protein